MKNTDPLMLEIQEEINRERMVKFANKYGMAVAIGAVIFFIALGLYQLWGQYRITEAKTTGSELYSVMREMDKPQDEFATKKLDATAENTSYFEISLLNKAQIQIKNNDYAGAIASFDAVAKSANSEKSLRDLAALNAANLLLNTTPNSEGLETRLVELAAEDNTFKYSAMELLAAFYIQNSKQQQADKLLTTLASEPNVPVTIATRAKELSPNILAETGNEEE